MGDSENIEPPPDLADRATVVQGMDVRVLLPHFCDSKRKLAIVLCPKIPEILGFRYPCIAAISAEMCC